MNLKELIKQKDITLPISIPNGKSVYDHLKDKYTGFSEMVNSIDEFDQNHSNHISTIIKSILSALEHYLNGKPNPAYEELEKGVTAAKILENIKSHKIEPGKGFFRARILDGGYRTNYPLKRKELFHIPFEKRTKVGTQRFSIPGFPSLYLSNSVYTVWEELGRPQLESLHTAKFINEIPLIVLDLTHEIFCGAYDLKRFGDSKEKLYRHLVSWPIIAACSIKVKERNDPFKPEYIIPQLLLQLVRNQEGIAGIAYSSSHINQDENIGYLGDFHNWVFPVSECKDEGYCPFLKKAFKVSDVVCYELIKAAGNPNNYLWNQDDIDGLNREIKFIGLIPNSPAPFYPSSFWDIEMRLKLSGTGEID